MEQVILNLLDADAVWGLAEFIFVSVTGTAPVVVVAARKFYMRLQLKKFMDNEERNEE